MDEVALLAAMDGGRLLGTGLDLTDPAPTEAGNPLLHRNDVIVTPHVGWASYADKRRILSNATEKFKRVLRRERPEHLLNPEVWERVPARIGRRT